MDALTPLARQGQRFSRAFLDALLPPSCLACNSALQDQGLVCADCWSALTFIAPPYCALCGLPFEYESGPEALCGACHRRRPAFDRARSVLRYDDASRRLILGFKHGDRTEAAPSFGRWLARAGMAFRRPDCLIVPVPLHWRRLATRRYNQAALLASALRDSWGEGRFQPDLLRRRRATPPQGHLSPADRRRNVAGAFEVSARLRPRLEGRPVLLVDDVMTTGATVEGASRCLKRAGAGIVDVLVLARVLKAGG